jgi:hypothetical protein
MGHLASVDTLVFLSRPSDLLGTFYPGGILLLLGT